MREVSYEVHMTRVLLTSRISNVDSVTLQISLILSTKLGILYYTFRYYGITVMHATFSKPDGKRSGVTQVCSLRCDW